MTFQEYAAIDAVNWSTLKEMRRSPLHYRHRLEVPREDNDALALGRAAHTAILEPDRFMFDYAVFKGARRAGKEWEAFKAEHPNETILRAEDFEACMAMRDAVRRHPLAAPYLEAGEAEKVLTWTDSITGIRCKGRLDWLSDRPAIVDLKTSASIDGNRFGSQAAKLGYHAQLAFYAEGYATVHNRAVPVVMIAVEKDPPHDVGVFQVDENALWAGAEEFKELLARLAECRANDHWPGRYEEEQVLSLPAWAFGQDEEEDDGAELGLKFGSLTG